MSPPASTDSPALFFKRQGISLVETQKLAADFQNEFPVADTVVGERHRRDVGDIAKHQGGTS